MILFAFFLSTIVFFLQLIPSIYLPIQAYIPWIVIYVLKKWGKGAYFTIAVVGAFIDLLSDHPFGLHPISYIAAAFFLAHYRYRFSYTNPLHLTLASMVTSLFSFICQLFLLFLLSDQKFAWGGVITMIDLLGRSIFDGIYAMMWFAAPFALLKKMNIVKHLLKN